MYIFIGQVVAQAVAFILTIIVLRIFAWKPILAFIDARRAQVSDELDRVEQMGVEAEARQQELNERLDKIESEARQEIQKAAAAGRKAADEITEQARVDAKEIRAHAQQMAEIELAKAMAEVKDEVVRMTMTATERLLREEVDEARHRQLVGRFIDELEKN